MAPTKATRTVNKQLPTSGNDALLQQARKGLVRRNVQNMQHQNIDIMQTRSKRKADNSPIRNDKIKRSALGNLTNNVKLTTMTNIIHPDEKIAKKKLQQVNVLKETQNITETSENILIPSKISTRANSRNAQTQKLKTSNNDIQNIKAVDVPSVRTLKCKVKNPTIDSSTMCLDLIPPEAKIAGYKPLAVKVQHKTVRRISNEFNKTEESLYMSALEDVSSSESLRYSGNFEVLQKHSSTLLHNNVKIGEAGDYVSPDIKDIKMKVPEGVEDFDKINCNDPFQVSEYVMDIFNYLKEREVEFKITDYMEKQMHLSKWMRTLLVDWMVEVQETFELNHETLYLAVKIVDMFLCKVVIQKDKLQLLGAAALFVACKYDERVPPLIEDFLYICDGAYKHEELIQMEMTTLKTIDYDLGIPLSYRFLRRYARCAKVPMSTLTLARYILELSLMDYATISFSDSKSASAALFMALRLHGSAAPWTRTLEYYTSYKLTDFADIVPVLNAGLLRKPKGYTVKTIRNKYSHEIFYGVAKVKLLTTEELFENNLDNPKVENCEGP